MQMLTTLISTRVTEEKKKKSYVSLKPDHLRRSVVAEHQEF